MDDPVRGLHEERVLWIDSLCINQSDGIEKTYQVGLMTEIYRNTWRGLSWLGEFEEDVVLKPWMDLESYRDSGVTMDKNHAQLAFQFVDKLSKLSTDGHFTLETENVLPGWVSVTRPEVTAIHRLVKLKWFTRIWTVQEFVLPQRVELVLGNVTCEEALVLLESKPEQDMWKHDPLFGRCCQTVAAKLPDFPALLLHFFDQMPSLRKTKRRLPLRLGYSISRFRYRDCADPKDKVFGLLGLNHPSARQLVDYTLEKKQVYTKCVRHDLVSTRSLDALMRLPERSRDSSLPSWVPDLEAAVWDDPRLNMLTTELRYIIDCIPLFKAGTQRSMDLSPSREDGLQLGGRRVDSIRCICNGPPPMVWLNTGDSLLMPKVRADWRAMIDTDPFLDLDSYPSGGTYTEAFWRTCTCDSHVPRDLDGRARRITVEDEEGVNKKLADGAYGSGVNPTKTFFVSHQGYIGIGPEDTRVGDIVYVLFGGSVPFLLRGLPDLEETRGSRTFVGHAYVHGVMDGEALEMDIPDEQVIIV